MKAEHWQKVKGLFDAALELAPAKREQFLDESCGNDVIYSRYVIQGFSLYSRAETLNYVT